MLRVWAMVAILCASLALARAQENQPAVFPQLGHASIVSTIAFSPDGHLLASGGGDDHAVKLWDIAQASGTVKSWPQ